MKKKQYNASYSTRYWIEVPIDIEFDVEPEERQTRDYPGSPAFIEISSVKFPTQAELDAMVDKEIDAIDEHCWEEVKNDDYDRKISRYEDDRYHERSGV